MTDEVPMAGGAEPLGLLETVKEKFKRSDEHSAEWRKNSRDWYDFVAGDQWENEDKQLLREQLRPIITFNRTGPIIEAVAGSEINNRQEVRYLPRTLDDSGPNEGFSEAARWVRDLCDAEDEESDAFMDTLICGMGWTETRMEYEDDLDGEIKIDRIDPLEMWWDPDSKKRNLADARWLMRVKKLSYSDIEALWPSKAAEVIAKGPWDKATDEAMGFEANANSPDQYVDSDYEEWDIRPDKKKIRVVEYQWWEREAVYRVATEEKVVEFNAARFKLLKDGFDSEGTRYLKQTKRVYKRAFIAGETILEEGDGPCDHDFTYKPITGKRDRNKNIWFGLVRAMMDPQRWANKFYSQILHVINTNAKGGILAEEDAFPNQRDAEKNWAKADSIVTVKKGVLQRKGIQPKPMIPYPTGLDRLMELAMDSHYTVTGVSLEMLGLADRNQPGVLEYQRKQAGLTILAPLFGSLRQYRKQQGRVLLYFIRTYISDGRLMRILGKEGAEFVPLMKQDETVQYDVIVDEAATSPNQKEKTFAVMTEILPLALQAGFPPPVEILEYLPLPLTVINAWKKSIAQQGENNEEMQKLQEQIQKLSEENAKLKIGEQVKIMQLQGEQKLDVAKFQQDAELADEKMDLKEYESERGLDIKERQMEGELAIKKKAVNSQNRISK